jgi:hypothetical protein
MSKPKTYEFKEAEVTIDGVNVIGSGDGAFRSHPGQGKGTGRHRGGRSRHQRSVHTSREARKRMRDYKGPAQPQKRKRRSRAIVREAVRQSERDSRRRRRELHARNRYAEEAPKIMVATGHVFRVSGGWHGKTPTGLVRCEGRCPMCGGEARKQLEALTERIREEVAV